jgi:hypothetical protein
MSYRAVKCWWCGQVPHPLDYDHVLWCNPGRNYVRAAAQGSDDQAAAQKGGAAC